MIAWLIPLVARAGVPQRLARFAAWIVAALVVIALCWAAVAMFRAWIADGKEEAVGLDRSDVTIEAANRVINATSAATANQMARDDAFQNAQKELRDEAASNATADPVGPATAGVFAKLRQQQAAGRRDTGSAR